MTDEINRIALRKGLLRRQRMIWFALLNTSTLIIGGYLALTHGNGTFGCFAPDDADDRLVKLVGKLGGNRSKARERRYWPAGP